MWITYKPGLSTDELSELTDKARANAYRLLSPFPGQRTNISIQAWGRQLQADSVTDEGIDKFLEAYTSGPQSPERGAVCTGTTDTGPPKTEAGAPAASMPPSST